MLIGLFLFGGAATFGILIAYLILAERELKEKGRSIEELESKLATASDTEILTEQQIQKFPEVEGEVAELRAENSRLVEQAAELGKERDTGQERIRQLEREEGRKREAEEEEVAELRAENSRLVEQAAEQGKERDASQERATQLEREEGRKREVEGEVTELRAENSRLLEQAAELGKERDASQERVRQLEREEGRIHEVEGEVTELRAENSRLLEQTNKLRSLILEKLDSQLTGLKGLYQQVSEADNS